ncbi:TIGR02757 family protein [Aquimarina sp. ERC-38]|uniref:TIGR02757 family protein n=1 Tax=Aquimarina sp. ERC-38 TaxID=2949996 RepID=UPI002247FCF4|nr:TIGR02757 family protein [Aquimarina sp. ERC-38]UZO79682.1 TIGR02757 family protein [Aquimarina sp. ERC-38]
MTFKETKEFLDEKAIFYEQPKFIESDPVQIPHLFSKKEDQEISGFLTATIAWGNRKSILNNAHRLMNLLEMAPYDFIMNHSQKDLTTLAPFVHRTFNSTDLLTFIANLHHIYSTYPDLESVFLPYRNDINLHQAIHQFKKEFFTPPHLKRTEKHVSDPLKNSAAKRIYMFLRWMVRQPDKGVDLGIWKKIPASILSCPLDVHSGNTARKLNILHRKQNDLKAVNELDKVLRKMDKNDPVKYDFSLFGLGVFEKF